MADDTPPTLSEAERALRESLDALYPADLHDLGRAALICLDDLLAAFRAEVATAEKRRGEAERAHADERRARETLAECGVQLHDKLAATNRLLVRAMTFVTPLRARFTDEELADWRAFLWDVDDARRSTVQYGPVGGWQPGDPEMQPRDAAAPGEPQRYMTGAEFLAEVRKNADVFRQPNAYWGDKPAAPGEPHPNERLDPPRTGAAAVAQRLRRKLREPGARERVESAIADICECCALGAPGEPVGAGEPAEAQERLNTKSERDALVAELEYHKAKHESWRQCASGLAKQISELGAK